MTLAIPRTAKAMLLAALLAGAAPALGQDASSPDATATVYRVAKRKIADDLGKVDKLVTSNTAATEAAKTMVKQVAPQKGAAAPQAGPAAIVSAAVATATTYNEQAQHLQAEAKAAIAKADATNDPARKSQLYLEAMSKADAAMRAGRTAADSLGAFDRAIPSRPIWPALEELRRQAAASGSGLGVDVFDGALAKSAEAATPTRNGGTNFFSIRSYDDRTAKAVLRDGTVLDLAPLKRAVRTYTQGGTKGPLIREVPLPQGSAFVPDVKSHNALVMAAKKADGVGGVALRVSLAALQATGGDDLRWDTTLVEIEKPVLISLDLLYDRLKPYAGSDARWAALPEELRHPGRMSRIHGFIADPDHDDLWIIGSRTDEPSAYIDVDTIILALQATWRGDAVPAVSLDRLPNDAVGPNFPRIVGLPADSRMAKTMLDADYLMKRILLGVVKPGIDGYRSLVNLAETGGYPDTTFDARFWFQPLALGPASIRRSASRRTIVYDAELQVLTESMKAGGQPQAADGRFRDPPEQAAAEFSRNLARLVADRQADPGRLFERLYGISDAVTLARLLRHFGSSASQLSAFAELPYRRLSGADAIPHQYPLVSKTMTVMLPNGQAASPVVAGGVAMRVGVERRSVSTDYDAFLEALERLVAAARTGSGSPSWLIEPAFSLRAPATERSASAAAFDTAFAAGLSAFNAGDGDAAVREFRRAVAQDSYSARANAWLAYASLWNGDADTAATLASRASVLDPGDILVSAIAYDVSRRTVPEGTEVSPKSPEVARRLVDLYLELGQAGRKAGDDAFTDWIEEALDLDPDNSDAQTLFGFERLWGKDKDVDAALSAFQDARRILMARGREALRRDRDGSRGYAVASLGAALAFEARVLSGLAAFDRKYPLVDPFNRTQLDLMTRSLLPENVVRQIEADRKARLEPLLKAADDQFDAAGESLYFQSSGAAAGTQLLARVHRFQVDMRLLKRDALLQELKAVRAEAARYIAQYPQSDLVFGARASLMLTIGDGEEALSDINRALAVNPGSAGDLRMRARILALMDRCEDAQADIEKALSLDPGYDQVDETYRRRCGG